LRDESLEPSRVVARANAARFSEDISASRSISRRGSAFPARTRVRVLDRVKVRRIDTDHLIERQPASSTTIEVISLVIDAIGKRNCVFFV